MKFDIIGGELTSDLFKQIRFQYQKLIFAIFNQSRNTIFPQLTYDFKGSFPESENSKNKYLNYSNGNIDFSDKRVFDRFSRYNSDFTELEKIASGGFGSVYRARNNLDENEYAIKKIYLKNLPNELLKKVISYTLFIFSFKVDIIY